MRIVSQKSRLLDSHIEFVVSSVERVLEILRSVQGQKAVLVGNHDLWCRLIESRPRPTSLELMDTVFPKMGREHGWLWLEDDGIRLGDIAICGTTAWYDYSMALVNNPSLSADVLRDSKSLYNNDGNYMDADWEDLAFAAECKNRLLTRLSRLESDPSVKKVFVVTHVPIFMEQRVRCAGDYPIADGYFYNLSLGREIAQHRKVTHVISGHTHRGVSAKVRRHNMKSIDARVIESDYGAPAFEMIEG